MLEQETPNIASMASLPTLSAPGLLVMDVDSTLIDEEVIDELGVAAGVGEQIASVTARAMNGELDFREALRARVALLKGLPTTIFDEVYHRVHFTHGALELIDTLHAHDWKVGVVSGGFHEVVDRLAADAHLDYWRKRCKGAVCTPAGEVRLYAGAPLRNCGTCQAGRFRHP